MQGIDEASSCVYDIYLKRKFLYNDISGRSDYGNIF